MSRKKSKKRSSEVTDTGKLIKNCFMGVAVAFVVSAVLLFLMTAILSGMSDPESGADIAALAILCIASLSCGFTAVKLNGGEALLCGLITALILNVGLFLVRLCFCGDIPSAYYTGIRLLIRAVTVFLSVLGGHIAQYKRQRRRRR